MGHFFLLLGGCGSSSVSTDTTGQEGDGYRLSGMKVLIPYLAFSDSTQVAHVACWVPCYSPAKVEVWAPHRVFAGVDEGEATVFSMVYGWSRVVFV